MELKQLLELKVGKLNLSKIIVAYLVGNLINQEMGIALALHMTLVQFFDIVLDDECECNKNKIIKI
jgi:hypothetical protein